MIDMITFSCPLILCSFGALFNENANIIISAEIVVSKNPVIGEPVRTVKV